MHEVIKNMSEEAKDSNFNPLVRISNVDIHGNKKIYFGLTKIKGVSFALSNAVCILGGIDRFKQIGYITQDEIKKIETILSNPLANKIPVWMLNRRKDFETGENLHLLTGQIKFTVENDIRRLQRIKARRGLRHAWGLPVRGQRTKANFRRSTAIGVKKSPAAKATIKA